jgi:Subtilase family
MRWFFQIPDDGDAAGHDDEGSAPGLISLPAALLQRHGALALDPGTAAGIRSGVPGRPPPPPRPTIYRARTLLVPGDLLIPEDDQEESPFVRESNMVLARVGMRLVPPTGPRAGARSAGPGAGILGALPRPAVLVPAGPAEDVPARPVVIDAWVALQALREAAAAPEHPALDEQTVSRIALEHLLISSSITGTGAHGHGGGLTGGPDQSSGVTGPGTTDSYTYSGGDTRTPVVLSLDPPYREPAESFMPRYGRRPVVAVLDTGVRAHPWLGVQGNPQDGYAFADDSFVTVDEDMQLAIYQEGQDAADHGDQPRQLIQRPWDTPITANPLVNELDTDLGHGTFIAGLVRQVAPDARVLAVRIMHSDGVVYEADLIHALGLLAERVASAEEGGMAAMIDVVSLSLGYFDESPADVAFSSGLWLAIEILLGLGVTVVAAAGNYSTSRPFCPAAFARRPRQGPVPLISVGALNPNGTKALFSDEGRWVTAWASGAAMVSTFPVDINGSRSPEVRTRAHPAGEMPPAAGLPRESLDADDFCDGFAAWSGTSFSAPVIAAQIARALLAGAAAQPLGLAGGQAATDRTMTALAALDWPG